LSGILTGGKGQQLVAVFGGYAGIVKRQFLALLNIAVKSSAVSALTD
jgi:hypothetical protein